MKADLRKILQNEVGRIKHYENEWAEMDDKQLDSWKTRTDENILQNMNQHFFPNDIEVDSKIEKSTRCKEIFIQIHLLQETIRKCFWILDFKKELYGYLGRKSKSRNKLGWPWTWPQWHSISDDGKAAHFYFWGIECETQAKLSFYP